MYNDNLCGKLISGIDDYEEKIIDLMGKLLRWIGGAYDKARKEDQGLSASTFLKNNNHNYIDQIIPYVLQELGFADSEDRAKFNRYMEAFC